MGHEEPVFSEHSVTVVKVDWSMIPDHALTPQTRLFDVGSDRFGSRYTIFAKVEEGKPNGIAFVPNLT